MSAIQPAIRSALQPAIRSAILSYGAVAWSPLTLFAASEKGVWYDPSDFSTMYQDSAGTTPVTAVGQPVGLILDKSKGLVLGSELVTNGDFSNGTTGWTGSATPTVVNGALNVTSTWATASTTVTWTAGVFYKLTFSAGVTGSRMLVRNGALDMGDILPGQNITIIYRAPSTGTATINFINNNGGSATVSLDNVSIKAIAGNHAYQATAASRPILGRTPATGQRNRLTYTEQFDNAVWQKTAATVTANAITAPDGTLTGDKIVSTAVSDQHYVAHPSFTSVVGQYTQSVYLQAAECKRVRFFIQNSGGYESIFVNAETGVVDATEDSPVGSLVGYVVGPLVDGWRGVSFTFNSTVAASTGVSIRALQPGSTSTGGQAWLGDGTSGIYVWGAQLETGSSATAYQKVTAAYDVTEAGVADCYNLYFDGVDDSLATAAIDFTATDKLSLFAGVRKLNDTAAQVIIELSASMSANAGAFLLDVKNTATQLWASGCRGTTALASDQFGYSTQAAPDTAVITSLHDISGDLSTFRRNGVAATSGVYDKGTGNFGNYALYIGRRGGTTLPFNGRIYSLTILGRTATALEIAAAESYVAGKSGVTL